MELTAFTNSSNHITAVSKLYLANMGFAMFSLILLCLFKLFFPEIEISLQGISKSSSFISKIIWLGFIYPFAEESIFRAIPHLVITLIFFLFSNAGIWNMIAVFIVFVSSLLWVLMHGFRALLIAPFGVFYGFILWNGLIIEGFIIHWMYNITVVITWQIFYISMN
jgi:membrane protease YdiL (CAAX protease family)